MAVDRSLTTQIVEAVQKCKTDADCNNKYGRTCAGGKCTYLTPISNPQISAIPTKVCTACPDNPNEGHYEQDKTTCLCTLVIDTGTFIPTAVNPNLQPVPFYGQPVVEGVSGSTSSNTNNPTATINPVSEIVRVPTICQIDPTSYQCALNKMGMLNYDATPSAFGIVVGVVVVGLIAWGIWAIFFRA